VDFSVYLTRHTDFDCGLFLLPGLNTLIFAFEMGLTAGVNGRQWMLTPPGHLILPLICPEVRVYPFISQTCISYLCLETDHCLVS
jgi:hypothetical protein